jgi:N-ATPase, AtpR subunit
MDARAMSAAALLIYIGLGAALGGAYFAALDFNVRLLMGGAGIAAALLLPVLRLAALGGAFTFAAMHGAGALAAAFGGFLVARAAGLRILGARS